MALPVALLCTTLGVARMATGGTLVTMILLGAIAALETLILNPKILNLSSLLHTHQANAEPPFLGRHRIQIQYWGGAIAALETLILRVGSLEAVLTSPEPLLNELRLQELLGR